MSVLRPEPGQKLLGALGNGARLLAWTVLLHGLSGVYNFLFWMLPPLFYLGIGWAVVYCGMYVWFGYQTRAGFWRGLLIGSVGALPGILLVALSLYLQTLFCRELTSETSNALPAFDRPKVRSLLS